jgi:hypothetical protein
MIEKPDFRDWQNGTDAVVLKYERCIAALTLERDEARAKADGLEKLVKLCGLLDDGSPVERAEARGYERGVKDAAKVVEVTADKFSSERTIRTILALLEKPTSPDRSESS